MKSAFLKNLFYSTVSLLSFAMTKARIRGRTSTNILEVLKFWLNYSFVSFFVNKCQVGLLFFSLNLVRFFKKLIQFDYFR